MTLGHSALRIVGIGVGSEASVDETTALLSQDDAGPPVPSHEAEQDGHGGGDDSDNDKDNALPIDHILALCAARIVEPIAFFSIFPFINQMIWDTGQVAQTDVGFYSGLIESLFSLTQMLLMIPWGWTADRLGRKPVLIFSLVGVGVAVAGFGLARTVWQMILFRCFAGIFGGTVVTIRTMMAELSTPKTQARIFSYFAFSGNLGIFLGPLIGGVLANPAAQYPRLFGKINFLHEFPYALPTIVTGSLGIIASVICAIVIKETLTKPSHANHATKTEHPSILALLRAPNVFITLFIYGHLMVLAFSYTAILPVFYFTPVALGGFGFTPLQSSIFMGLGGLSQALWVLLIFPYLHARIGTKAIMTSFGNAYPVFFASAPLCNILLRYHFTLVFWILAPVLVVLGSGVAITFTAVQLVINDVSPTPRVLGTLNAMALTLVSGLRAFSPALFASLFAASVKSGKLGGHVIWILMVALAASFAVVARWTPEVQGSSKTGNGNGVGVKNGQSPVENRTNESGQDPEEQ